MRTDPRTHLPLTPIVLHILLVLAEGDRHGYAIAQEIETATNGQVRAGPGTMYGSIQRMLTAALIEEIPPKRRAADDDGRRRYYRISSLGEQVLALELQRLVDVVRIARDKQLIREPRPV